jgi:hypothetical protein
VEQDIDFKDFAAQNHIGYSNFRRMFTKYTGVSPGFFVYIHSIKHPQIQTYVYRWFLRPCGRFIVYYHVVLGILGQYPEDETGILVFPAFLLGLCNRYPDLFPNHGFYAWQPW